MRKQLLDTTVILESLGAFMEWCEQQDIYAALLRHNDPDDLYCIPLYSTFVVGYDIKPERQVVHVNFKFASIWFLLNETCACLRH